MQIFKCIKKKASKPKSRGKPKTRGNFRTRDALEQYVINRGRECMPISDICSQAGVSRGVVDGILMENKIMKEQERERSVEMQKVDRFTIQDQAERIAAHKLKEAAQEKEISRLSAIIKLCEEWPPEESDRNTAIGQNGNNGEHYNERT